MDFEKSEIEDDTSDDNEKDKLEYDENKDNESQEEEAEEEFYQRHDRKHKNINDSEFDGSGIIAMEEAADIDIEYEREQDVTEKLIEPKKLPRDEDDRRKSKRYIDDYDENINSLAYYYEDCWRLSLVEYKARRLSYINEQKLKKELEARQKIDEGDVVISPDGTMPAVGKILELFEKDEAEETEYYSDEEERLIAEFDKEIFDEKSEENFEYKDEEIKKDQIGDEIFEEYEFEFEDEQKKDDDILITEYRKAEDVKGKKLDADELKKFSAEAETPASVEKSKKLPILDETEKSKTDAASDQVSSRPGKINALLALKKEIAADLHRRQFLKLFMAFDDNPAEEVTPPILIISKRPESYKKIREMIKSHPLMVHPNFRFTESFTMSDSIHTAERSSTRLLLGGIKISMDEVLESVGSTKIFFAEDTFLPIDHLDTRPNVSLEFKPKFIKVTLECTHLDVIYDQASHWVSRDFEKKETLHVEQVNKRYDFLVSAKGRVRRRSEAETQTENVLPKTRWTNTITKSFSTVTTHVSNFEMYDSVMPYWGNTKRRSLLLNQRREAREYIRKKKAKSGKTDYDEQVFAMFAEEEFLIDSMIVRRILASNEYNEYQGRYRSRCPVSKISRKVFFGYNLELLFRYYPVFKGETRVALSNLSFCTTNNDIIAAGYGVFSYAAMQVPKFGAVYVWHIKNPTLPERVYEFKCPVVSIAFSPYSPTLLAIGLYDGHVQVVDIKYIETEPLAISRRVTFTVREPIVDLKWIKQSDSSSEISPFIALALNGHVIRFRIINSPNLLSYKQMILERVEGMPEGLSIKHTPVKLQAHRYPQGMCLALHPEKPDIYFIMTDEGCINKCSLNYHHQYLEVYKAHDGAITCFDFSPWSPKIFLTSGNDWCIRIWIDGILRPLLTLKHTMNPVHCAYWSRTHSTIIIALNRRSFDIWDIRRTILKPVTSELLDKSFNTVCKMSKTGRLVLIGNERGNLLCCALDNMPFEVHFQFDELHKSIFKWIRHEADLLREVKSIGFLGYPNKGYFDMGC